MLTRVMLPRVIFQTLKTLLLAKNFRDFTEELVSQLQTANFEKYPLSVVSLKI